MGRDGTWMGTCAPAGSCRASPPPCVPPPARPACHARRPRHAHGRDARRRDADDAHARRACCGINSSHDAHAAHGMLLNIGRCCATGFGLLGHQDTQPGWVPCQVFSSMPPGLRMPRVVTADGPGDSPAQAMPCLESFQTTPCLATSRHTHTARNVDRRAVAGGRRQEGCLMLYREGHRPCHAL